MPCLRYLSVCTRKAFKKDTTIINFEYSNLEYFRYEHDMWEPYYKDVKPYLDSVMNAINFRKVDEE